MHVPFKDGFEKSEVMQCFGTGFLYICSDKSITPMENQIVIYQTDNGQTAIDVRLENEMLWLTRHQIAVLFDRDYKTISKHINNALKEELSGSVVVAKFATTTQHGAMEGKTQTHDTEYFNLEVITSVGYRVKSQRGVQFRQWAT